MIGCPPSIYGTLKTSLFVRKKRGYVIRKLEENRMVPRKFWKEIHNNLFIGNIKSNVANIQVQSRTGELVEGLCAACEINSYYATVGEKLAAPFDTPKKGLSKKVTDYQPVSVLPAPSKIIERAVYNQIVYHLESHGLLDRRQHGF